MHGSRCPATYVPWLRKMADGSPCWCVSDDAPHEGWVHAPVCIALRSAPHPDTEPVTAAPATLIEAWGVYTIRFATPDDMIRTSETPIRDAFVAGWDAAIEATLQPDGRCVKCGGRKGYWAHDTEVRAETHAFVPRAALPEGRETVLRELRAEIVEAFTVAESQDSPSAAHHWIALIDRALAPAAADGTTET
jgi:hypothetical protein